MNPRSSIEAEKPLFTEPGWYQALTLSERLVGRRHVPERAPRAQEEPLTAASMRLERWKQEVAPGSTERFAERLAMDTLTEEDLLWLLAEPPEELQQRVLAQAEPEWLGHLQQLWQIWGAETVLQGSPDAPDLATVLTPFLVWGSTQLRQGLKPLPDTALHQVFPAGTAEQLFLPNLLPRLQVVFQRALVLELHIARLEGRLVGENSEARYTTFLQQLCQPASLYALLRKYPLLARSLLTMTRDWANASLELAERLCTDWSAIRRTFSPEADPGSLLDVQTGAGDTHRQGRSVAILRFSSGARLVYKPRSLALDQHFQEVLRWVNTLGLAEPLRPLTLLDRGNYGWVEYVAARDCATSEEVRRFYARQGSYLALLYALEATDFHHENILAAGEHPVLVDLEALFHARLGAGEDEEADAAARTMGYSVLRTGLLPIRRNLEKGGMGVDHSGLGGQDGQLSPWPLPTWKEGGTDQMHLIRERRALRARQNRPTLQGQPVEITAYTSDLLQGFTHMYRLLVAHREAWLTEILPGFEQDEVRVILRPTQTYATFVAESFHPQRLRDGLERERLFDLLWEGVSDQPHLRRVLAAERADLWQGDVPLFTTRPGSRDLFTSTGERIEAFCPEPGLASAERRIRAMDERDLALQQWIIQASLGTTLMGEPSAARPVLLPQSPTLPVTRAQLLQAALVVGARLEALAVRGERGVNWLGVGQATESQQGIVWQLRTGGVTLYDGLPGIILFLSYLGACTGEARPLDLAEQALRTLEEQLDKIQAKLAPQSIGAFGGWGSLIYLFAHLAALRGESAWLGRAQALVEVLDPLIEQDNQFDLISGAAGGLACLLTLYHLAPAPRTLQAAIHCGEHLLAQAQELAGGLGWYTLSGTRAPAGMSHGVAGIALSLFRLAEASQQERFAQAARAALTYERSLFSPEQGNWVRLLVEGEHDFSVQWCHGAPGIGLARLAGLPYQDDVPIRQEIAIALETTITRGFGANHSLCHGDLGNLETVLVASRILEEPGYAEGLTRLTAEIVRSIEAQGWVTGIPLGVETPGLMIGLAGIGYELLRLAEPERVPSVLSLAPPLVTR